MPQPSRRLEIRLTISAAAPYIGIAGELAGKFAVYSGAENGAAERLGQAVVSMAESLGDGVPDASIALTLAAGERELVAVAESGTRQERAVCPLPPVAV